MTRNTLIFYQPDGPATDPVFRTLVGSVISDTKDYSDYPAEMIWNDAVIADVFSPLIAQDERLLSSDAFFTLLYHDTFGRPVSFEKWRFNLNFATSERLRSVMLSKGKPLHCTNHRFIDSTQLRIFIDRTGS